MKELNARANKEERQMRLKGNSKGTEQKEIIQERIRKEKEVKVKVKAKVKAKVLLQEVFGRTEAFEILDSNKSNLIVEDFFGNFLCENQYN